MGKLTWPLEWTKRASYLHYVEMDERQMSIIDRHWTNGEPTAGRDRMDPRFLIIQAGNIREDIKFSDLLELKCWLIAKGYLDG